MQPVRTLIVDDSAAIRATLAHIFKSDPEIEVVGMAPEPHSARTMIKELNPDVITLDVEMPGMDGLSFLERIMRLRPMPVVMCSSLTAAGAEVTIEALRLGAVDCIAKPTGGPAELEASAALLCRTVKNAARSSTRPAREPAPAHGHANGPGHGGKFRDVIIAIGASTGGVEALFHVLSSFPENCPPTLVVQHMPAAFTGSFADRLNRSCPPNIVEARDGQPIVPGTVYIAPGGTHHMTLHGGLGGHVRLIESDPVGGHRPSVDTLFRSVASSGAPSVGALLTGMGADGAQGLLEMRQAGAPTFGQTRESCVVWGMPRAALELGAVQSEISLSGMAGSILSACSGQNRER
ncbi:chemotaxis response regulator protein-glutamate methylesterase [Stakelama sp. CBK3Z-3]|uniref:Protein-glutamate methylesterase/protein-glutamine glutaminase n=1 Tax=Stakelama flava TaxID=2860338 RepID=A0ABS6XJP4_9SPHN|nr:chemotaxis response regulator protein-glutamate methylesterase [Stakelama flava]MBW4330428.1 chemotaxis response regulator protein-glutamate methylesterase [Stakelama flava]